MTAFVRACPGADTAPVTYSVVARCPDTGRLGVGVQTHYLAVGSSATWAQSGAGAIATQAHTNPMYGAKGLQLLAAGVPAPQALARLLREDDLAEMRQVAFVDAAGTTAAHTGLRCIAHASHLAGEGVVFAANLMRRGGVTEAMATSWAATSKQPLEFRLVAALHAAEDAGGDLRGQQSAALRVCEPVPEERWWEGTVIDLRVDDSPTPLTDLGRLLEARRAYLDSEAAQDRQAPLQGAGPWIGSEEPAYGATGEGELSFWHGVSLANAGNLPAAEQPLRKAYQESDCWRELLRRLSAAGLLHVNDATVEDFLRA